MATRKKAAEPAATQVQEIDTSFLKDETVIVKYIMKPSPDIRDPQHIAYGGKLNGCLDWIVPPRLRKDRLKNVLTDTEKKGLEYLMNVNLSIYSDFWKGYNKESLFPIGLGKDNLKLNLSDPEQYIQYKVLINNPMIATSEEDLRRRSTYKYIIVKEADSINEEESKINQKETAYELYSAIKNDSAKMRFILRQFGKYTSVDQKLKFLRSEIGKLIDTSTRAFINYASDDKLEIKVLIQEGLELGVIRKLDDKYYTADSESLADEGQDSTIENAAAYLSSPIGQELRLSIEARIKNARE